METRIAISGMPRSGRTLIAYALSRLTGITFIQGRTMYEWYDIHGLAPNGARGWKDIFLVSSSALFERIEMERKAGNFISDGAVFSELMYLRLTRDLHIEEASPEHRRIVTSLENVGFDYAAHQYDMVIHMETPAPHRAAIETKTFREMFDRGNVPYEIHGPGSPVETLGRIASRLDLPTVISAENAFSIASNDLYVNAFPIKHIL